MAVHYEATLRGLFEDAGQTIANQFVNQAKGNAPVGFKDSVGKLKANIWAEQTGEFTWLVSTHSVGWNGFAYPARVEAGEAVHAAPNKVLVFPKQEGPVFAKSSRASSKSHFMEKTVNSFHI